jgi:hypothetical protein
MEKKPSKPPLTIVGNPAATGLESRPNPPRKLGKHGLSAWNSLQAEFHITDAGGIEVLAQACAAVDRAEALKARIDAEGETIATRGGGLKAHPALTHELAARSFVTRALSRLGLLDEPLQPLGRPGKSHGWDPYGNAS